jgi:dihydroorotate dehydrogenase
MSAWRIAAYHAVRPLLFCIDPERMHAIALRSLAVAGGSAPGRVLCRFASGVSEPALAPAELAGLRFRNRIGLGAGFDKDGVAIRGWAALGFGFVELGTVTPRPQPGNPRPRLFRLPPDEALVNRMGFNNAGADALARRIADARPHLPDGFVVGANIGRNRDTPDEDAVGDYVAAARALGPVADYLAINVSSPNTQGLRNLQEPERLRAIVAAVAAVAADRPIFVKLAPDLDGQQRGAILEALGNGPTAGLILSNTTVERDGLRGAAATEPGGLSGRPLLERTGEVLADVRRTAGDRFVVVASGGLERRPPGADLVELWTAMIYRGPGIIGAAVGVE